MKNKMDSVEDIITGSDLDDIIGKISSSDNLNREFKPWHKPRKQWVRSCQLGNSLDRLLSENDYDSVSTIRYFGFPGEDCLDIRVLSERCFAHSEKHFFYYGLESDPETSKNIQDLVDTKLRDIKYISKDSVIKETTAFEVMSSSESTLFSDIKETEPFHLINLDFTNSVFSPGSEGRTVSSICNLVVSQFEKQYKKWLLCITTRCDKASLDTELFKKFISPLLKNCEAEEFKNLFVEKILLDKSKQIINVDELMNLDGKFTKISAIVLLKWILCNAVARNTKMKVLSAAEYSVSDSDHSDLVTIVVEFKKVISSGDATGVVSAMPTNSLSEVDMAKNIIEKIANIKNVDSLLIDEPNTMNKLKKEMIELLKNSHDVSRYPY